MYSNSESIGSRSPIVLSLFKATVWLHQTIQELTHTSKRRHRFKKVVRIHRTGFVQTWKVWWLIITLWIPSFRQIMMTTMMTMETWKKNYSKTSFRLKPKTTACLRAFWPDQSEPERNTLPENTTNGRSVFLCCDQLSKENANIPKAERHPGVSAASTECNDWWTGFIQEVKPQTRIIKKNSHCNWCFKRQLTNLNASCWQIHR